MLENFLTHFVELLLEILNDLIAIRYLTSVEFDEGNLTFGRGLCEIVGNVLNRCQLRLIQLRRCVCYVCHHGKSSSRLRARKPQLRT